MKVKRIRKACYLFFVICLSVSLLSGVAIASAPSSSTNLFEQQESEQYFQVSCAEKDAMYVGKDIETGEYTYFNVETTGATSYLNANGEIERTAPAYFPPELVLEQIDSETISPYGIIGGKDTRKKITVGSALPYSAIAYIETYWPDKTTTIGTAWMFYSDILVTAGHCVYSKKHGGWASNISVWVGTNGTKSSARATGEGKTFYTSTLWIASEQVKDDWGVIELTESIASKTGYLGIHYSTADMSGRSIEISGYPGDHVLWQYSATGTIDYCEEAALFYKVPMVSGQSGSPILIDGSNKATGINTTEYYIDHGTYKEYTKNGGSRMTPSLFDYLMSFRD